MDIYTKKSQSALNKAVQAAGSYRKLADLINNYVGEKSITGEALWAYKGKGIKVPAIRAVQIERCRADMPKREELRPDLFE